MNPELRELLVEVVSSWQVIAVTIALVIYLFLVTRVSRINREARRKSSAPKPKAAKKKKAAALPVTSDSDDLGIEIEEQ